MPWNTQWLTSSWSRAPVGAPETCWHGATLVHTPFLMTVSANKENALCWWNQILLYWNSNLCYSISAKKFWRKKCGRIRFEISSCPSAQVTRHTDFFYVTGSLVNTKYNKTFLTFIRPAFTYVNAHKNTPKIDFIYLGNKEIYCIFKTSYVISFIFLKIVCFIVLSHSVQMICFS
jgi:hypothetical protein